LTSKNLLEVMVLGLQQDKLKTINVVISSENSAVQTQATLSETAALLGSLKPTREAVKAGLNSLPEL